MKKEPDSNEAGSFCMIQFTGQIKSRRLKAAGSPPLPWGPYYNLHVSGRWVTSPVLPRFQLPTPRSRGEPGGLQSTQEYGVPY